MFKRRVNFAGILFNVIIFFSMKGVMRVFSDL